MSLKYLQLATTPSVQAAQEHYYGRARKPGANDMPDDRLGPEEAAFVAERDSFYLATISENGWPYIQHRGGAAGFLHVLEEGRKLGFVDLSGNQQLLTTGNVSAGDGRVALFLMDYPNRTRLKINGHAEVLDARDRPELASELARGFLLPGRVERVFLISVVSFDWNCPQHITPRFTLEQVEQVIAPLQARIAELEAAPPVVADPPVRKQNR